MKANSMMRRLLWEQSGQVLPWVAILMTLLFAGLCALVVDIGRGIIAYHMLQSATDAAVMAGAQMMPTATNDADVITRATLFSAVPGSNNANDSMLPNASMISGYPSFYCSSTVVGWAYCPIPASLSRALWLRLAWGPCKTGANALVVAEQVDHSYVFCFLDGLFQHEPDRESNRRHEGVGAAAV